MNPGARNIGWNDRLARAALGVWLLAWSLWTPSLVGRVALVLLGAFCLYMSVYAWCALYAFLGKNTCPAEE
ncbi:MAG TPA: DUF2892 domain-containing protein [Candidatus Paceibacterota bacterium]